MVPKDYPGVTLAASPRATVDDSSTVPDEPQPLRRVTRIAFAHERWNAVGSKMLERPEHAATRVAGDPRRVLKKLIIEEGRAAVLVVYSVPVHTLLSCQEAADKNVFVAGVDICSTGNH